ncbi:trans-sialidase [Trypanosoma cruzi]|nr:trans-sialidase [Trypanosoma cruzi]
MEDGMLVFPFAARNDKREFVSINIYSTNNGNNWVLLEVISFAECLDSHTTEWEGSPFMVVLFESGRKLYELHEMGTREWRLSEYSQACGSSHEQESLGT